MHILFTDCARNTLNITKHSHNAHFFVMVHSILNNKTYYDCDDWLIIIISLLYKNIFLKNCKFKFLKVLYDIDQQQLGTKTTY